jgi:hypothetical protein
MPILAPRRLGSAAILRVAICHDFLPDAGWWCGHPFFDEPLEGVMSRLQGAADSGFARKARQGRPRAMASLGSLSWRRRRARDGSLIHD